MQLKDFQFVRQVLLNEIDLSYSRVLQLLECEVEVRKDGEPDSIIHRGEKIIYHQPSSVLRFLFNLVYATLSKYIHSQQNRDFLGLSLIGLCREYVYSNFEVNEFEGPPVLVSFRKISVPEMLISEVIEPLTGRIERLPVFFTNCPFTDTARIVRDPESLVKQYGYPRMSVNFHDYPLILCNLSIDNPAARMADLLYLTLEHNFGSEKAKKIIQSIMIDDNDLLDHVYLILKTLNGEPDYILNFTDALSTYIYMTQDELLAHMKKQSSVVKNDPYLSMRIKEASHSSTQVFHQWSQWSMMLGLIEKQLGPMRGSLWPATEKLKPIEDRMRKMVADRSKKKGGQLNFEELLEIARDMYNHNAGKGTLVENLLKENRVWQ